MLPSKSLIEYAPVVDSWGILHTCSDQTWALVDGHSPLLLVALVAHTLVVVCSPAQVAYMAHSRVVLGGGVEEVLVEACSSVAPSAAVVLDPSMERCLSGV